MKYTIIVQPYEDEYFEGYEIYCIEIPVSVFSSTEQQGLLDFSNAKEEYFATLVKENKLAKSLSERDILRLSGIL